jgi:hypothetical protein
VKIPWDGEKQVGEAETPFLGELISPKNSQIPRRNQGIPNGGLGVALMVVLEKKRERREKNGEGGSSIMGFKLTKTG